MNCGCLGALTPSQYKQTQRQTTTHNNTQQTLLYVQLHHRGKRTLHRLLLRNAAAEEAEAQQLQRRRSSGTSFHLHAHSVEQEVGDGSTPSSSSSSSSSDDGLDDSGVLGNGEEEGWDLRTGEVEAQRAFLQLLELTDVRDEPGVFFNDDATRAAKVIAERHNGSGRASRSNSGSNSPLMPPLPWLSPHQLRQQQQQQRLLQQPMGPGQPRQRRRSTLSTEITD